MAALAGWCGAVATCAVLCRHFRGDIPALQPGGQVRRKVRRVRAARTRRHRSTEALIARRSLSTARQKASALELARSLQRIEAQAGFSRTAIAVEGDRPDQATPVPSADEGDQTQLKPVSVVSGSAPRDVAAPRSAPAAPDQLGRWWAEPAARWAAAVVVLLVLAVVVGKMLTSGSGPTDVVLPPPTGSGSVVPGVAPRPILHANRTGDSVEFRWRAADAPQAGDAFQWRVPRKGGSHLTTAPSVTIHSAARVCLQVRLARPNLPLSTYAAACA